MPESRVANGNILPSTCVNLTSTADGKVDQCTSATNTNPAPFGISQKATRFAPFPGLDDGYCAIAGENLLIYTFPDKEVYANIGVGGCTPRSFLKPGTNGTLVISTGAASPGEWVIAIARGTGNAGDLVPVDMVAPFLYAST